MWAKLLAGMDTRELLRTAIEEKVMYVPGAPFYAEGQEPDTMRLCFSMTTPERIRVGAARLGTAFRRQISR